MALFDEIEARLTEAPGRAFELPGLTLRESAVLVPLFLRGDEPFVLLTLRTSTLRTHAGQISFPGGGRDPEDPTPLHTALRELDEELGISSNEVRVLGALDESPTTTGYRIWPYVGEIPAHGRYAPSEAEIAEILEVPLRFFLDPAHRRTELWPWRGEQHEVHFYDWGQARDLGRDRADRGGARREDRGAPLGGEAAALSCGPRSRDGRGEPPPRPVDGDARTGPRGAALGAGRERLSSAPRPMNLVLPSTLLRRLRSSRSAASSEGGHPFVRARG